MAAPARVNVPAAKTFAPERPLASLHRGEVFPGDAVGDDADALTQILKTGVGPYNHANGTVRMGPRSDPQAVVDRPVPCAPSPA